MQRPQNVSLVIHLQWVVIALSVVLSVMDPMKILHTSRLPLVTVFGLILKLFVMFFLTYRLSIGRNRARVTLLVIFCLSTLPSLYHLTEILRSSFTAGVMVLFQATLQAIILVLVFTPSAHAWFNNKEQRAFDHARDNRLTDQQNSPPDNLNKL